MEDSMKLCTLWIAIAVSLFVTTPALAQSAKAPTPPATAAGILNALPPDLHKKLQQLSELGRVNTNRVICAILCTWKSPTHSIA